jgi:WD40 repeat protein/uncharacterized caspase-like protein
VATGRVLRNLRGNTGVIWSVAIAPDGSRVASIDYDHELRVWDPETGKILLKIAGQNVFRKLVFFSRDGKELVVPADDQVIRYDAATGKIIKSYKLRGLTFVHAAALSSDGQRLLTVGDDPDKGTVILLDLKNGNQHRLASLPFSTGAVAFSPDGRRAAATAGTSSAQDEPMPIVILDVESGRTVAQLTGHKRHVNDLLFSADSKTLFSSSDWDYQVRAWDLTTQKLLWSGSSNNASAKLAPTSDPNVLASAGEHVAYWDSSTGSNIRTIAPAASHAYGTTTTALPDGNWLLGSFSGFGVWDMSTGQRLRQFGNDVGHEIESLAKTKNDDWRVSTVTGALVKVWDIKREQVINSVVRQTSAFSYQMLSPDGSLLVFNDVGKDGKYTLLDAMSGKVVRSVKAHDSDIVSAAFSPDGKRLITMGADKEATGKGLSGHIKVWDLASGRLEGTWPSSSIKPSFLPDSRKFLAGGGFEGLKIFDVEIRNGTLELPAKNYIDHAALSPDSRLVAATGFNKLSIWQLDSGKKLFEVEIGEWLKTIGFSQDSRYIIGSSGDGTVKIWSSQTSELLVTTVQADSGEWITITPEGFFVASERGAQLLQVVRGFEVESIDQFYQSLYRPDLVREKLAGDPRGLVREAAAELDLNRVIESGRAPDVRLTLPGRSLGTRDVNETSLSVDAEITDRGGGVGRIEWRVNGVTAGIDTPSSQQSLRITRSLQLDTGENAIEVVAYNRANLIASLPGVISVTTQAVGLSTAPAQPRPAGPSPALAVKPRLFVLVAGVNDYADRRIKLSYAVSDAREVARGFKEASGNLYQSVEIKLMLDAEVTPTKLDSAFAEMAGKAKATDVFVLYIAGHGKTVDGRYYFIPQDFVIDGELSDKVINASVKATGIAQEQWQRWFASIPARRSVILFDTCDSGRLAGDETQQMEKTAANDRLAQATGRSILTASGGSEEALEGYHGHGLFTYEVLDALNQADGDRNGTIELSELAAYVYAQVADLSLKIFRQRQVPQMKIAANYPLATQTRILQDATPPVAQAKPTYQVSQATELHVQPAGSTVVRSLSAKTDLTVLESKNGWSLVASEGRPLGYVATRDLSPIQ